jgi:magnesium transporter
MNIITKKVTGWAAIVAVPTFITGFYGMNVPYPGFDKAWGFGFSIASMIIIALFLYLLFKKKDWI